MILTNKQHKQKPGITVYLHHGAAPVWSRLQLAASGRFRTPGFAAWTHHISLGWQSGWRVDLHMRLLMTQKQWWVSHVWRSQAQRQSSVIENSIDSVSCEREERIPSDLTDRCIDSAGYNWVEYRFSQVWLRRVYIQSGMTEMSIDSLSMAETCID